MEETGRLLRIWVKRFKRGPMDAAQEAELVRGQGLKGNANQGGRRQVILLAAETWSEAEQALGSEVDPAGRRGNLLVSGIALAHSRDRVLQVGSCRIRILGEARPCDRMEEAQAGLRKALDPGWRAGVFGEVLVGGTICVGDAVRWDSEASQPPSRSK